MFDKTKSVFVARLVPDNALSRTSITRTFIESLQAVIRCLSKWKVLMRAKFWVLCPLRVSLQSSLLFSWHSFTPTIEIVMQEESNINKRLTNSCFVKFQYVSLWPLSPLCTTLCPFCRRPGHTVKACSVSLSVVIVVIARAADTLFLYRERR